MATRSALLRLDPSEEDGPSLAKDCAGSRLLRIDDTYGVDDPLPEGAAQRPGPLPAEEGR